MVLYMTTQSTHVNQLNQEYDMNDNGRHPEDRLNGVVEAAIGHCMDDECFLQNCADDIGLDVDGDGYDMPDTPEEVFQALESYVTNHLARDPRLTEVVVDHAVTDFGEVTLYNDHPKYWNSIVCTLTDVVHNGQDAWSDSEWAVIELFLADVLREANVQYKQET